MVRQHVNPLSAFFQTPRLLPPPADLFIDTRLPIHLDIGCARGRFLMGMARQRPDRNHLGIDIRRALVAAAENERQLLEITNLRYLFCNANVSLEDWLALLAPGQLELVTVQFPDPWFKTRHHKRRVLQPALLQAISMNLQEGAQIFMQSDVRAVIDPMVALTEASGCFEPACSDQTPWLLHNPLPVPTEREEHVTRQGLPVYRALYRRTSSPAPDLSTLEACWNQGLMHRDNPASQAASAADGCE